MSRNISLMYLITPIFRSINIDQKMNYFGFRHFGGSHMDFNYDFT